MLNRVVVAGSEYLIQNSMQKALSFIEQSQERVALFAYEGDLVKYQGLTRFLRGRVFFINKLALQPEELRKVQLKLLSLADELVRIAELKKIEEAKIEELKGFKKHLLQNFRLEQEPALLEFLDPKKTKLRKSVFASVLLHLNTIDLPNEIPGGLPKPQKELLSSILEKFFPNKKNVAKWLLENREVTVEKGAEKVLTKEPLIVLLIRQGRFDIVDVLLDYCRDKLVLKDVILNDDRSIFQLYIEADQPEGLLKLINRKKININSEVLLENGVKRHIAFDLLYKIESLKSNESLRSKYIQVLGKLIESKDSNLANAFDKDGEHLLLKLYTASSEINELQELFEKLRVKKTTAGQSFCELKLNNKKQTLVHIATCRKDEALLKKMPAYLFSVEDEDGITPYMFSLITGAESLEEIVRKKLEAAPLSEAAKNAEAFLDVKVPEQTSVNNQSDISKNIESAKKYFKEIQDLVSALPIEPADKKAEYEANIKLAERGIDGITKFIVDPRNKARWYNNASVGVNDALDEAKDIVKDALVLESVAGIEGMRLRIVKAEKKALDAQKESNAAVLFDGYNVEITADLREVEAVFKAASRLRGATPEFELQIAAKVKKAREALNAGAALKTVSEQQEEQYRKNEINLKAKAVQSVAKNLKEELRVRSVKHKDKNKEGVNLLMAAVAGGNVKLVRKFIEKESYLKAKDKKGACVLHYVGSVEVLNALLERRINQEELSARFEINQLDSEGFTPLMRAVAAGKIDVAKALLEAGADVNICNYSGISPLMQACSNKDVGMVDALLASPQVDVNYRMNVGSLRLTAIEMIRYLMIACHLEFSSEPGKSSNGSEGSINSTPKSPEKYNEERQKIESICTLLIHHNADRSTLTDPKITIEKQKSTFRIFYNVILKTAFRHSVSSILNLLLLGTKDNPFYTISDTGNKLLLAIESREHLSDQLSPEIMDRIGGWKYKYEPKTNATGMGFKIERAYFLPVLRFNESEVVSSRGILSFIWEKVLSFRGKNTHVVDFDPRKIKFIQNFFSNILKKAEGTGENIKQSEESEESKKRRQFKVLVENLSMTREQAIASHEELLVFYVQLRDQVERSFFVFGAKDYLSEIVALDRKMLQKVNVIFNEDNDPVLNQHHTKIKNLLKGIKGKDRNKLINDLVSRPDEYKGFIQLIGMIRNKRVIIAVDDYYEIIKFERELEKNKTVILGNSFYSFFKKNVLKISNSFSKILGVNTECDDCKFNTSGIREENVVTSDNVANGRVELHYHRHIIVRMIEKTTGDNIEVSVRKVSGVLADLIANVTTKIAFGALSTRMQVVVGFAAVGVSFFALPYVSTLTLVGVSFGAGFGAYKVAKTSGVFKAIEDTFESCKTFFYGAESKYKIIESEEDRNNIKRLIKLHQYDCSVKKDIDVDEQAAPSPKPIALAGVDGSKISHNAWGSLSNLSPIILGLSLTLLFGLLSVNEVRQGNAAQIR